MDDLSRYPEPEFPTPCDWIVTTRLYPEHTSFRHKRYHVRGEEHSGVLFFDPYVHVIAERPREQRDGRIAFNPTVQALVHFDALEELVEALHAVMTTAEYTSWSDARDAAWHTAQCSEESTG